MLFGIVIVLVAALYGWTGRSPIRERIATWSFLKAVVLCASGFALAILIDPDHGIVKQGTHMWVIEWLLLLGSPTVFARWLQLRDRRAADKSRMPPRDR